MKTGRCFHAAWVFYVNLIVDLLLNLFSEVCVIRRINLILKYISIIVSVTSRPGKLLEQLLNVKMQLIIAQLVGRLSLGEIKCN